MKKLTSLACALALAGSSAAALAADDWTGPYAGLSLGHADYRNTWMDASYDWYGGNFTKSESTQSLGLQLGYNHQVKSWVVGAEFSYTHVNADMYAFHFDDIYRYDDLESVMSLRARAGVAVDNTLLYVTAGLAQVDSQHAWHEINDVPDSWPTFENDGIGSIAGFGLEHKVSDNLSWRTEVLNGRSPGVSSTNPDGFTMTVTDEYTFINVGMNFLF